MVLMRIRELIACEQHERTLVVLDDVADSRRLTFEAVPRGRSPARTGTCARSLHLPPGLRLHHGALAQLACRACPSCARGDHAYADGGPDPRAGDQAPARWPSAGDAGSSRWRDPASRGRAPRGRLSGEGRAGCPSPKACPIHAATHRALAISGYVGRGAAGHLRPSAGLPERVAVGGDWRRRVGSDWALRASSGGRPGDVGLCGLSEISMMQTTNFGNLQYRARLRPLNGPGVRCILLQ